MIFQFLGGPGPRSTEYLLFLVVYPLCEVMDGLIFLLTVGGGGGAVLTGPILQLMELRFQDIQWLPHLSGWFFSERFHITSATISGQSSALQALQLGESPAQVFRCVWP